MININLTSRENHPKWNQSWPIRQFMFLRCSPRYLEEYAQHLLKHIEFNVQAVCWWRCFVKKWWTAGFQASFSRRSWGSAEKMITFSWTVKLKLAVTPTGSSKSPKWFALWICWKWPCPIHEDQQCKISHVLVLSSDLRVILLLSSCWKKELHSGSQRCKLVVLAQGLRPHRPEAKFFSAKFREVFWMGWTAILFGGSSLCWKVIEKEEKLF